MDTSLQQCPVCSRVVSFSHPQTTLITCDCGSVISRKEGGILLSKPYYKVQAPLSVLQPGSEGKWQNKRFTVLGRFRAWIEEFVFNYWTIVFEDGRLCYLGEGYGIYAVYEKIEPDRTYTASSLKDRNVGNKKEFFGNYFLLERKYHCHKWEIEGEVLLPETDARFQIFEFADAGGRHLELIQFLPDNILLYDVFYSSFEKLHFRNLREFEYAGKKFTCRCGSEAGVKTFPFAQSYGCIHCGSRYALEVTGDYKLITERNRVDSQPVIPFGARGLIKGIKYEMIGYAIKEENNTENAQWREYTLFNESEGYAFLSEYNGHWIYVREKGDAPVLFGKNETSMTYGNEPFQLFNSYSFEIKHALGEFPYNIFDDGDKRVYEYISPPEIWICEKSTSEGIIWFQGEHMEPTLIKTAFGKNIILPYRVGTGAVDPRGFISKEKLVFVTFIALIFLVFAHLLTVPAKREQVLMDRPFSFADTLNTVSFVTKEFHLDKWRSNLQFDIYAPVDNSWFELSAVLVNTKTGTEYSFEQGVERYSGYSGGEYWTEGSKDETAFISRIPAGNYQLQLLGTRPEGYGRIPDFSVRVTYDVSNHRNLLYCTLLLLIWPVIRFFLIRYHEARRWENSPYTPFNNED